MSDDSNSEPPGKVARLHPPRLPHQAALDRGIQAQIGAQLRTMYEHYVEQPIPDRLIDLVSRLGQAETNHPQGADGEAAGGSDDAADRATTRGEAR